MDQDLELIIARLEILEIGVCNILQNPGNIGKHIFLIQSYPGNIGNLSLQHSPESWKYWKSQFFYILDAWKHWESIFSIFWISWKYWKYDFS